MMNNIKIDISKLKNIESGHMFIELDKKFEKALKEFSTTLERAKMALIFAQQIGWQDGDIRKAEGYFRASLCELVSMEETLKKSNNENHLSLFSTKHPLLILLKLLRNIEIHLSTRRLAEESKSFIWGAPKQEINFNVFVIERVNIDDLKKLNGYEKFKNEEKSLLYTIDWFNTEVERWGIVEILLIGIHEYLAEIELFSRSYGDRVNAYCKIT